MLWKFKPASLFRGKLSCLKTHLSQGIDSWNYNSPCRSFTFKKAAFFSKRTLTVMAAIDEGNQKSFDLQDFLCTTPTIGGTLQRAVQVTAFRGPKKFLENTHVVVDKAIPKASIGEVVIRMKLRSLNPADGLSLMGIYGGFTPTKFPATPGVEGMGVVDSIGAGVQNVKVGQRVVPLLGPYTKSGEGSWQEYCKVASTDVIVIPDSISDEVAAQMVVNPVTAYGIIQDFSLPPGGYLLQSAAGSVLGRLVIALCKHLGFKTINIVRRAEQADELKALGADEVICSTEEDVVARVKEITGDSLAWGAIDSVAGDMTATLAKSVRNGGTVFVIGGFSSPTAVFPVGDLIFRDVSLKGWWLSRYLGGKTAHEKQDVLKEVVKLLAEGVIEPFSGEKFDLADFKAALKKQQEKGRGGKVLLSG